MSPSGRISDGSAREGPTSGSILDGGYVLQVTVPALARSGTWSVQYVSLPVGVGKHAVHVTSQLATAGFPTTFTNN
ncbi:MAG: hypothetical protein ABI949_13695 [Ilumatobacteraceae bacterium]